MADEKVVTTELLKDVLPAVEEYILDKAKKNSPSAVALEPAEDDIPIVYISGTIPQTKDLVKGELEYVSKTERFRAYTLIKLQGNSTLALPKKNLAFFMYSDEYRSKTLNKDFRGWGKHNNFVLKADYNDITHARNVVCARLWGQIMRSRADFDSLPEGLRNSPNGGAIDGFPVKVYIDSVYQGLYNWTIGKCDWMFGMDKNNPNHAVLGAEINDNWDDTLEYNPCNFNADWSGEDGDAWSVEAGKPSDALTDSFNAVVESMRVAWDTGDYSEFETAMDKQTMLDYYIFQEVILGVDGLAKNMNLATYDMVRWYPLAYDLDCTFDMDFEGYLLNGATEFLADLAYNGYSKLHMFAWEDYWDEYRERYAELRKTVLSYENIVGEFEKYLAAADEDLRIKDTVPYPDIPEATTNTLDYIRAFVKARLAVLDMENMPEVSE